MGGSMKASTLMINKEGVGTFYWLDGRIYSGQWKDGKQHGFGKFYNPEEGGNQRNKQVEFMHGEWVDGKRTRW